MVAGVINLLIEFLTVSFKISYMAVAKCKTCKGRGTIWSKSKRIGEHVSGICNCAAGDEVMRHPPFTPIPLDLLTVRIGTRNFRIRLEPI